MAPFIGGSVSAMAGQICEGHTLLTAIQLKRLSAPEITQLAAELERDLRDLRAGFMAPDDRAAMQVRNRKISRLTGALQLIQAYRSRQR